MNQVNQPRGNSRLWTPANVITMIRVCMVPLFVIILISPWPEWIGMNDLIDNEVKSIIACAIFIVISATDWMDGYLARSRNEVTDFGKFMDPLADKILVVAALLALVELQILPSWPVLIILIREFIVSGVRMICASKGKVVAASWYGKAKTVFQIIAIVLFLLKDIPEYMGLPFLHSEAMYAFSWAVMIVALALTIISMIDYLTKAWPYLKEGDAQDRSDYANECATELVRACKSKNVTISTAESLTGGMIASIICGVPGSSEVFKGGIVSYQAKIKESVLGVSTSLLDGVGAVDANVAKQMAEGANEVMKTDYCVSVTGIAGPTGAEAGKPIGTVFIGIADGSIASSTRKQFHGDRFAIRTQTATCAIGMLLDKIKGDS